MTKARNYDQVQDAIKNLEHFEHSSCRAEDRSNATSMVYFDTGYLPRTDRDALIDDFKDAHPHHSFYVVYSYGTPIGWSWFDIVSERRMRRIPDAKYSVTTSKQQGMVRAYLPGKDAA